MNIIVIHPGLDLKTIAATMVCCAKGKPNTAT